LKKQIKGCTKANSLYTSEARGVNMLKSVFYTFFLILLAELGDKTQIATMLLSAKSNSIMAVFIGSSFALICSSFIGVFAGTYITKYIPPHYIQNVAGILFIAIGILILGGKL